MNPKTLPPVMCLPHGSAAGGRSPVTRRRLAAIGGAVVLLTGCTTFGTNINGTFTCGPSGEGSCAPATVIDDRALAEITGDARYSPAGPYRAPLRDHLQNVIALEAAPTGEVVPGQQKVLRIVFPAHVDRAGRYHETSVVKAIVENGAWMQASASPGAALAQTANLTVNPELLSQLAAGSAQGPMPNDRAAILDPGDPHMPSPEAIAAARARGTSAKLAGSSSNMAEEGTDRPAPVNRPAPFYPVVEE